MKVYIVKYKDEIRNVTGDFGQARIMCAALVKEKGGWNHPEYHIEVESWETKTSKKMKTYEYRPNGRLLVVNS